MNIIISEEKDTRIIDGVNEILNLDNENFNKVIEKLSVENKRFLENIYFYYTTDKYENSSANIQLGLEKEHDENGNFISRCYFTAHDELFSISQILTILADRLKEVQENSNEYIRIKRLLETRDLNAFKTRVLNNNENNELLLDKVFEILDNDDFYQKFLDYNNNKDYFSINGQEIDVGNYLKYLGEIFGDKDKLGNVSNENTISKEFYIPKLDEYKQRYLQIFDKMNIDRYVNPMYEFKEMGTYDKIIRQGEEPNWTINEELNNAILHQIPDGLSLEEKAIYIYCKLCKELSFDEGYIFREHLNDERYNSDFIKEHLERITPNTKITCWDFSRIFSKMINSLDGEIEAVIIAQGENEGHFLTGFYTDNVSVMLEPINLRTEGTNDLMKAKNGIEFEGIEIISDRESMIDKALEKIYPQVFDKSQSNIKDYLMQLKSINKEEVENNVEIKLQSFVESMKENNIAGNEAIQTFSVFNKAGFFGEILEKAYLGKEEYEDDKKKYRRLALIRSKNNKDEESSNLYLLDSDSLELSTCTSQEIISKLKSGEFIYESEKHKIDGIDKEER